jgi:type VI secretion system Hcp family effector
MKFEGAKSGWIKGEATASPCVDYITLNSLELGLGHPIDANTHLATGRQVVRPLVLTKTVDKSSPLLINSCATNEVARTVTFAYTRTGIENKLAVFLTVVLKNATVQDFNHVANADGSTLEKIALVFTTMDFTWTDGGIMASVDAIAPT